MRKNIAPVPARLLAPLGRRSGHESHYPCRLGIVLSVSLLAGCLTGTEPLMETPVLYADGSLDPFAHLTEAHREPDVTVFYATERSRGGDARTPRYGNRVGDGLRFGRATVRIGSEPLDWERLCELSLAPTRPQDLELGVERLDELAFLPSGRPEELQPDLAAFLATLNAHLEPSQDPELVVYVHGAKVDLERALERWGELTHFAGRDLVPLVFDWPSHQNILAYAFGSDAGRAEQSAPSLADLLELLARHTSARRIHLVGYSAGARVVTLALSDLHQRTPDPSRGELRLGVVLLLAGDVRLERFLQVAPALHELAERITVTASDADHALALAEHLMGSGQRIGELQADLPEEEREALQRLPRFELVDLSRGQEARGFDISGHRYWYRHPWVSSEIILNLRTDRPAEQRGLEPGDSAGVWFLPPDYPERARAAARRELVRSW
jgi:esterase/lipase superfamily enzyme